MWKAESVLDIWDLRIYVVLNYWKVTEFKSIKNVPVSDKFVNYELGQLIRSDTVISAVIYFQNILKLESNLRLSEASHNAISYAKEIFTKNVNLLEKGITPETDNTIEQIFSLIGDS